MDYNKNPKDGMRTEAPAPPTLYLNFPYVQYYLEKEEEREPMSDNGQFSH